jgi:hypothetical protein
MLTRGQVDGFQEHELWLEMQQKCPTWFLSSLGIEDDVERTFLLWLMAKAPLWLRSPRAIAFLIPHSEIEIEVHVAFVERPTQETIVELLQMLSRLWSFGYQQIVVPVTSNAGRTIRRILRLLGFSKEGTMPAAVPGFDIRTRTRKRLDLEIWSILRKGDHDGL